LQLKDCQEKYKRLNEQQSIPGQPSLPEDTAYFKHFLRKFSKHMQPLQGEEHKVD